MYSNRCKKSVKHTKKKIFNSKINNKMEDFTKFLNNSSKKF